MKNSTMDYKVAKEEELLGELKALKRELFNLKFSLAMNQLDNPTKIQVVKKNIARIHTELTQRKLKGVDEESKKEVKEDAVDNGKKSKKS